MPVSHALILGIVQGITEFLPISSSGHLILIPKLLGWEEQSAAFDAVMHLATLSAVIVALRTDVRDIFTKRRQLGVTILLATIPVVLVGLLFKNQIETGLRSPFVVAASLAVWGVLLYIADRQAKQGAVVSRKAGILIGFAQAISLIPGTSRSGVTITAGLFAGLNRETAARFSFLLGIPAIAVAGASGAFDFATGKASFDVLPMLIGFLAAFFAGFLSIRFLLTLLKSQTFAGFAVYRIILAAFVLSVFLR